MDDNATPDQVRGERSGRTLVGSADHVAEQVQAKVLDAGVDGVIINCSNTHPVWSPRSACAAPTGRVCRLSEAYHFRRPACG
jgi:alkanesulfonate monooxygenase SsuD/methylene tetrahydromethanopterin reductase-like flavin-dependent oxidoreductase (luciferase family)